MTRPENSAARPEAGGGKRRWPRRLAIAGAATLGLAVLAVAGLYLAAQSAAGRTWILQRLEAVASTPGETEVTLRGLHGTLPHDLRLERLVLADRDGTWLSAEDISLEWRPLALLSGRMEVRSLTLASLEIVRPPAPAGAPESEARATGVPKLPVALAVERLAIEDLALGAAVLGAPARLTLRGEATADHAARLAAALVVERRDGTPGRLAMTARYAPAEDTLGVDLEFAEPADGLVARLLDLPDLPALALALNGTGPLADWRGTLSGTARDLAEVSAEVTLARRDAGFALALAGSATVTPRDEALRRALAGTTPFALDARWRRDGPWHLDRLSVETAALAIAASGRIDPGTWQSAFEANARLRDPALLAVLQPDLAAETLEVTLAGEGPLLQPRLTLAAAATGLRQPPLAARRFEARATFDLARPLDAGPPQGPVSASGRIEGIDAPVPAEARGLLAPGLDWRLAGRLDLAEERLDVAELAASGPGARLSGSGSLALDGGRFDADGALALDELAGFSPLLSLEMAGAGQFEVQARKARADGPLAGSLAGRFSALRLDEPLLQALSGPTPRIESEFAWTPDGELRLDALALTGAGARLSGDAVIGDDFTALSARYRVEAADLAVPSQALGLPLGGAATIEGTAEGAPDDPRLAGRLEVSGGRLADVPFGTTRGYYEVRDPATAPRGRVAVTAAPPDLGEVTGESAFTLDETTLQLTEVRLSALRTTATGQLAVPLDGAAIAGALALESRDIAPLLARAGLAGNGTLAGRLELAAGRDGQSAGLTAEVARPRLAVQDRHLAAEGLTLEIAAENLFETPRATAKANLRAAALGALRLDALRLAAQGTLAAADFELTAQGDLEGPLELTAAGRVARAPGTTTLEVARLEGRAFGRGFELRAPTRLERSDDALALSALDLTAGEARLTAEATLDATTLDLAAELQRLDLATLAAFGAPPGIAGLADGRVAIAGPRSAPRGELSLAVTKLQAAAAPESPEMALTLTGRWQDNRLAIDGDLAGLPGAPARLTAELPLRLDGESLALSVAPDETMSGRLDWRGAAAAVWPLVPLTGHRLDGALAVNLALAGRPAAPRLGGQATLTDGTYENLESGTILQGLDLRLDLEDERAVLSQLSANDGNGGTLRGSGAVDLDPARAFPFAVTTEMNGFTAIRRDEATAVASGTLQVEGDTRAALLSGALETQRVELRIPDRLPPQVVDLEVIETGGPETQLAAAAPEEPAQPPMALRFDLALDMPRRVFLRGRGLDSEWSGRFKITGPAEAPVIDGKLEVVRGQLALLGKTFKLTRGEVTLPPDADVDPLLDVEAEHRGKSITVTARVTGRASNPSFELSSVPEYPRDEIVSRLLFEKGAGELSAVQAAQLAAAVAELSGVGGGGGLFMDRFRSLLGVDVLGLEAATGGGTAAIGAGRYLSDDVYVGVQKDVGSESGSVEVEVELTPNVSVQSGVESTGDSDIGIEFKWDY